MALPIAVRLRSKILRINALKGQNKQDRAPPYRDVTFAVQALKGLYPDFTLSGFGKDIF
jgi:hypothetical protein